MRSPTRLRSATPPPDAAAVLVRAGGAPEIRGDRRLVFYPSVFDVETVITEGGERFREIVRPGAFSVTLASDGDVYACREHSPAQVFARRSTGLLLQEDGRGLFASAYLPPGDPGDLVLADVLAGRLRGCSFAFRTTVERRTPAPAGGLPLVELLAVELVDVALTANPAYPGTVVSVRADQSAAAARSRRLRLLRLRGG